MLKSFNSRIAKYVFGHNEPKQDDVRSVEVLPAAEPEEKNDVKQINAFFRDATKQDIQEIENKLSLTEFQVKVFSMYYVKKQNIGYIADILFCGRSKINDELKKIRNQIKKIL